MFPIYHRATLIVLIELCFELIIGIQRLLSLTACGGGTHEYNIQSSTSLGKVTSFLRRLVCLVMIQARRCTRYLSGLNRIWCCMITDVSIGLWSSFVSNFLDYSMSFPTPSIKYATIVVCAYIVLHVECCIRFHTCYAMHVPKLNWTYMHGKYQSISGPTIYINWLWKRVYWVNRFAPWYVSFHGHSTTWHT